jgi:hypothetical protein
MPKWEYKSIKTEAAKGLFMNKGVDLEKTFNELGAQGWELVHMVGLGAGGSTVAGVQAVFKRMVS